MALISYKLDQLPSCSISSEVLAAITRSLAPACQRRIEGIVYLLGRTDGTHACVLSCVRVAAIATAGSFHVPSHEMVRVVTRADEHGLQVVGQVHTHPHEAFHSEGDDAGAQIRFNGFVSIVLPDYGAHLPTLQGAASFAYDAAGDAFVKIASDRVHIVTAQL